MAWEWCISPAMQRLQSVNPHYLVSIMIVSMGPEAYPSCFVTYMSLHLAMLTCGSFNWKATSREFRQPITFEEV
jgi:hypothetical protein